MKTYLIHGKSVVARIATIAVLVSALTGSTMKAVWADDVTIKSVDNYAGNSNVYTGSPNTTITVTELDADKKPVRSWTGTTDSDGKLTIQAGHNLSKPYLKVETSSKMPEGMVIADGLVVPSTLTANEPFTFAVKGVVEGEVIDVKTVQGEVVQRAKADKYGRVFLATGLAAGTYQIVSGSGSKPAGQMIVRPKENAPALIAASTIPAAGNAPVDVPLQPALVIQDMPPAVRISQPLSLHGAGISPNAADMQVQVGERPENQGVVLASTANEMTLVMPMFIPPDRETIKITNTKTAKDWSSDPDTLIYDLRAQLQRQKLSNGDRTVMSVNMEPKLNGAEVQASILDGPVRFTNGQQSMTASTRNGQATFPIAADGLGAGKFHVSAALVNAGVWFAPKVNEFGGRSSSAKGHDPDTGHGYKGSKKWGPKGKDGKETLRESIDEDYEHGSIRKRTTRRWDAAGRKTEVTEEYFDENGKQTGGAKTTWEYDGAGDSTGKRSDKTWSEKGGWK